MRGMGDMLQDIESDQSMFCTSLKMLVSFLISLPFFVSIFSFQVLFPFVFVVQRFVIHTFINLLITWQLWYRSSWWVGGINYLSWRCSSNSRIKRMKAQWLFKIQGVKTVRESQRKQNSWSHHVLTLTIQGRAWKQWRGENLTLDYFYLSFCCG